MVEKKQTSIIKRVRSMRPGDVLIIAESDVKRTVVRSTVYREHSRLGAKIYTVHNDDFHPGLTFVRRKI